MTGSEDRQSNNEPLLTFRGAEISFDGCAAITDISFTLHSKEILCIVGESGSGKSTILKAAMGLLGGRGSVTGGDILFKEKSIAALSERELQRLRGAEIGMIFQDAGASFCQVRTIGSQIYESMSAHMRISRAQTKAQTMQLFEQLGLKDGQRVWDSYPFELSGGMQQRAGIAAAMLMKPPVLLADEPTSALDTAVQKQVLRELKALRSMFDTAILMVTHDIGVVADIADTVLVLKDGRIMEYGAAKDVLESPQHEYTRRLLAAVPKAAGGMQFTDL